MANANIYISTFRWNNHSTNSGYDQLTRYMPLSVKKLPNFNNNGKHERFRRFLNKFIFLPNYKNLAFTSQYLLPGFITELYCFFLLIEKRNVVFHFIYGENEYSFLWRFKKLFKFKIILTYHQPAEVLQTVIYQPAILKHVDFVILMSNSQRAYFDKFVDEQKLLFVPHGINTDFFLADARVKSTEKFNCIIVGNYLRDYQTLKSAIQIIEQTLPGKVVFNVVTNLENRKILGDCTNVAFFNNIQESELLQLYRDAHLCICPLIDSTANNALLEGLACGLPVIVTDVGGSRDYGDDTCCIFVAPQNPDELASAAINILSDEKVRLKMGTAARKHALKFDWREIAKKVNTIQVMASELA